MIHRLVAVVLALMLLVAACGDDSGGDSPDRDAVIELFEQEGESPEAAACYADELSDFSTAEVEAFLSGETELDVEAAIEGEDQSSGINTAVLAAVEACG